MESIFYHVAIAQNSGTEILNGKKLSVQTTLRRSLSSSRAHSEVIKLAESKKQASTKKEVVNLNKKIKEELSGTAYEAPLLGDITDLEGRVIGSAYASDFIANPGNISIGDIKYIKGIEFHFTEAEADNSFYIRAIAYLTKEGIEGLRHYLKRNWWKAVCNRNLAASDQEVRRILKKNSSFDTRVNGKLVSANLNGKISLFTPLYNAVPLANANGLSPEQQERFRHYVKRAPVKLWVRETNQLFNNYVGNIFSVLGGIIDETYAKYDSKIMKINE